MARTSTPWALLVTAANTPDAVMFEALLDDIPTVRTPASGRRCRPDKVHADKAYDNRRCRGYLTRRGIKVWIARRGVESSERLGCHRWKAERSIAWLAGCRRLRIAYDRDSERFFAFAMLGCAGLCYNRLPRTVQAYARALRPLTSSQHLGRPLCFNARSSSHPRDAAADRTVPAVGWLGCPVWSRSRLRAEQDALLVVTVQGCGAALRLA